MRAIAKYGLAGLLMLALPRIVPLFASQSEELPPAELVRRAVTNEVAGTKDGSAKYMFRDERKTPHIAQTKLLVETREATAGVLIAINGRPLAPEQQRAEEARLQNYVRNPEELNRKRKQEREDTERSMRIMRALPDAFLYQPDGKQPGSASMGRVGGELVRLKFRPNPDYAPPSRVEQVLTGMEGHLLIDPRDSRIAEIDATLQKDVGFGWGILGHLDKGGRFLVQQASVGKHWELTRMELSFTGKILLIRRLTIRSSDVFSDFRPVPSDLSFAEGVELLKKAARNRTAGNGEESSSAGHAEKDFVQNASEVRDQICCGH